MNEIATDSIEEGLDFAFNLIIPVISKAGQRDAQLAQQLLVKVEDYVTLRYAGELYLAYEWLLNFDGLNVSGQENRVGQFRKQMAWINNQFATQIHNN